MGFDRLHRHNSNFLIDRHESIIDSDHDLVDFRTVDEAMNTYRLPHAAASSIHSSASDCFTSGVSVTENSGS